VKFTNDTDMKVYIILDVNLDAMQDISVGSVYFSKEEAFSAALESVLSTSGTNIKVHNYSIEGYDSTDRRISNNNSLGSDYGVSYKSSYGSYPCCRMIVERTVKGA